MATVERVNEVTDPGSTWRFNFLKWLTLLLLALLLLLLWLRPADPVAIDAPSLAAPGGAVLAGPIALNGAGTPESIAALLVDDRVVDRATVDASGRWRLTRDFTEGAYNLRVQAVDEAGAVLAADEAARTELRVFRVPTLSVSAEQTTAAVASVTARGEGTPGSTVRLLADEASVGDVTVNADGQWRQRVNVAVPSTTTFVAEVLDEAGRPLGRSGAESVTLAAPPPSAPPPPAALLIDQLSIASAARDVAPENVALLLDVAGRGEPTLRVQLRDGDTPLGEPVIIGPDGQWTAQVPYARLPGDAELLVRMFDADGTTIEEERVALRAPAIPIVAVSGGATDEEPVVISGTADPGAFVAVLIDDVNAGVAIADDDGAWSFDGRLPAGPHTIVADAAGVRSDAVTLEVPLFVPLILGQNEANNGAPLPGFFGIGRPGTTLDILEGDVVVGSASVNADGQWQCACRLAPGPHVLYVREAAEPARASASITLDVANPAPAFIVTVDPDAPPFRCPENSPPGEIVNRLYRVGCGESMSVITARLGTTPEALVAHNPQLPNPPRFYPQQLLNIPEDATCFDTAAGWPTRDALASAGSVWWWRFLPFWPPGLARVT